MCVNYSNAKENLSITKGKMKYEWIPNSVHDTKLDT